MKTYTILAAVLSGLIFVSSAHAATVQLNSIVGVNSTDLSVTIEDGVAVINGEVDSPVEAALVSTFVSEMAGVDEVVNHIISH